VLRLPLKMTMDVSKVLRLPRKCNSFSENDTKVLHLPHKRPSKLACNTLPDTKPKKRKRSTTVATPRKEKKERRWLRKLRWRPHCLLERESWRK
jgi:hypothetical protein